MLCLSFGAGFVLGSDWVNVFKPGKGTITIYENRSVVNGRILISYSRILISY